MSQARRGANQVDRGSRSDPDIINVFFVLPATRVEVERSRICHIGSRVVRRHGDVIAYLALVWITFERIERITHLDVRRPGNARVRAPGIE